LTAGHDAHAATQAGRPASSPRSRAYARARRHSFVVRAFKVAIPIGAVAAIGVVGFITLFDPFGRLGEGISVGPVSLSGTKIAMEAPRLTGFRQEARPYEVTATRALQDVRKPTLIELEEMRARMAIDEKGTMARLEATAGVFDTQKEQLELRQSVTVTTDDGQEARLRSAFVDFKAGTVVSKERVGVKMSSGTIEADGLEVSDGGKAISFIGRVNAVFDKAPPAEPMASPPVAGSSASGKTPPFTASRSAEIRPAGTRTSEIETPSLR
jgi:lipopolysaccharide export system protein LptC